MTTTTPEELSYVQTPSGIVLVGSCLDRLRDLDDGSIDSIVTDPPYEIGFMSRSWDSTGIAYSVALWVECLRVLKPGGHLLAFGATRSYHRMACAIEDAGFEIRDSLHWSYGSGFPKSHDIGKAIDREAGAKRTVVGSKRVTPKGVANAEQRTASSAGAFGGEAKDVPVTVAATADAKQWDGWGTALKPSHEPIVVARKSFTGTVAGNVLAYGTGALNIDACRVGASEADREEMSGRSGRRTEGDLSTGKGDGQAWEPQASGRWPANTLLTHNADCDGACTPGCPVADLDQQSGNRPVGKGNRKHNPDTNGIGAFQGGASYDTMGYGDTGGASRFFTQANWDPCFDQPVLYYAKPSKRERNAGLDHLEAGKALYTEGTGLSKNGDGSVRNTDAARQNTHPTVKPVALMRHLCRLVTPPGGVVLDPFLGSGTTAVAAILEGFQWVGCEMTADYLPIISGRVAHAEKQNKQLELPL